MTTRELYTATIETLRACDSVENASALIPEFETLIAKLDARNEKAKARPRKENAEVAGRKAAVAEFIALNEGEFTGDEIAETLNMTSAQVASAMRVHVAGGAVTKGSRKIDSKHTKVVYKIGA